jgi:hypothetical protein
MFILGLLAALSLSVPAADRGWTDLLQNSTLENWERIGDGVWTLMRDRTLVGQRDRSAKNQAWLYTKQEYENFDLSLDYWLPLGGNSGISIRDGSRARWAVGDTWDRERTPSHIGYEIQLAMSDTPQKYPSGSIYLFQPATVGAQIPHDWNQLEIASTAAGMAVKLNGKSVCEHPGDPKRARRGPIGLQLHDPKSLVMFRNIRLRVRGK